MSFSQNVFDPKLWSLKNAHFHIFYSTKAQTIKILTRITFPAIFFLRVSLAGAGLELLTFG
jgi:hypothetical protein